MKQKLILMTVLSLIVVFFLSGCASILTKSNYPLVINTDPQGVDISITNKKGRTVYVGQSPATVKLNSGFGYMSKAEYVVKLSTAGYDDHLITVGTSIEGWYFGNILFGGLIGMLIVDPLTGAMWSLDTEEINVTMKQKKDAEVPTLQVLDINDISEEMRKLLVRVN